MLFRSVQLVNVCPQVSPALLCFLYLAGQFIHLIALGDDNLHQLFTIPLLSLSRYVARSLIFVPDARMSGTLPKKLGLTVFFERTSDTTWASLLRPPSVVGTESCFSISSLVCNDETRLSDAIRYNLCFSENSL